jgi:hypothetical protein
MVLIALLCGGVAPALGGATMPAQYAGLSGTLVVCKEYGTVLGTFLTDLRGRDLARLNYLFGEDVRPRFSADGERVIFTSTRGGTPGLWTMNRKGEEQKRICDGDQGDWFPDGRRIAFRRRGEIVERSLETGKETVLSPAGWKSCSSPACSPDGQKILFMVDGGAKDAIFLMTPGAAEPKRLAEGETLCAPRWAPSGDRIAYQSGAHIWMMDADGSNQRQVTTTGGIQRGPAWSPDAAAIAYCQGASPKGPWQIAVTRIDGTGTFLVPQGGARSVLCPDWGAEQPGQRPPPEPAKGTAVRPPPRIHLWEIVQPLTALPADWAAFSRERKGWSAVPIGDALPKGFRGGCVVENEGAVFLLLAGNRGAVFIAKPAARSAIELAPLDPQGREAGPVEAIRLLRCGPDEVELESSSLSAGGPVRVAWTIGGSRALVRMTPVENTGALRIAAPLECVVATDRFGDDIVVDPETVGEGRACLPWTPAVTGLFGDGSGLLVLICPEQGQRMALRKGNGRLFLGADVAFQNRCIFAGVITGERAWRLERFGAGRQADPLRFTWRMPHAATWRLTVQGDGKRYSTLFCDRESPFFDKKDVIFRKSQDFAGDIRLGAIYLYDRVANTPLDALTPVDLVRDALGLKGAQRALDEEGLTGYRMAAGPTTWADLSGTIQSLRCLFERQLEVQDSVYAAHLCDDILPLVEGMEQRLGEYERFARDALSGKASPAVVKLLEGLTPISQKLRELGEKQRGLKSPKELLPLCAKIKQLTAKDSSENRKQFEECCKQLFTAVGPREEMLKAYRKLAIELADAAGSAPLTQPELLDGAEQIRALCQSVLRNRLYVEADWRGEDYEVPAFWLGPRPFD